MKKLFVGFIFISLAIFILTMIARPFYLSGDCMEPAVKDGSYVFLNRIVPYFRNYRIDDIVIFEYEGKIWISRIVGLENDTIEINNNGVLLNNKLLSEKNFHRDWENWKYGTYAIEKPLTIPSEHVYVLSDKLSAHHDDSRVFGPIPQSSILGTIW